MGLILSSTCFFQGDRGPAGPPGAAGISVSSVYLTLFSRVPTAKRAGSTG